MIKQLINKVRWWHPRVAVVLHDLTMVWVAWQVAYYGRYSLVVDAPPLLWFPPEMPIVIAIQGLIFWWTGLYRGLWRFASLPDLWNIVRAVGLGTLVIAVTLFLATRLEGVPRSMFVLYPTMLMLLLGAPRLAYRYWKDHRMEFLETKDAKRVLILGAGAAGEMLARDLLRERKYVPVAFLDDKPRLRGARVRGIPVLGTLEELPLAVRSKSVDALIIAMPSASSSEMQRIVDLCEDSGVPFRTLPKLQDMVENRTSASLRDVAIEDLLGRDPVSLDWVGIHQALASRVVLVTGGGGSIGSELCRQIARIGPTRLVILENSEFNLYEIERQLHLEFPQLPVEAVLGDVCEPAAVERVFVKYSPQIVFHAAAYKHVPLLETHLRAAVRNNVTGTRCVADMADRYGADSFVLISTDKAVNPANVMGATKRLAELYCRALDDRSDTRFVTVRFGNVLDSAGSVVPLFRRQIDSGGPITVTHPEISRFFMTIPEACMLILQAASFGDGGEIFVLDMGEPVNIRYLAEQMIRLAGKRPGEDIEIVYTGLRPGEKLFEELFYEQEDYGHTPHEKIFQARRSGIDWKALEKQLTGLEAAVRVFDEGAVRQQLAAIVPYESQPSRSGSDDNVVSLHSKKQAT
ncbi:MAG: multidrug MFS transporter [Lysobacteraceae bacterium]|nr:MAG: multidrug MFS transporter [Xanthomonadaceae bacterium]